MENGAALKAHTKNNAILKVFYKYGEITMETQGRKRLILVKENMEGLVEEGVFLDWH